jgi:hypothetical protein
MSACLGVYMKLVYWLTELWMLRSPTSAFRKLVIRRLSEIQSVFEGLGPQGSGGICSTPSAES